MYGYDCGYGNIDISNPLGTGLLVNDKVDYSSPSNCSAASVYDLNPNATSISTWTSYGGTHSFIHHFGQGRVFYYSGDPGYGEYPNSEIVENDLDLFEAGLMWIIEEN